MVQRAKKKCLAPLSMTTEDNFYGCWEKKIKHSFIEMKKKNNQ